MQYVTALLAIIALSAFTAFNRCCYANFVQIFGEERIVKMIKHLVCQLHVPSFLIQGESRKKQKAYPVKLRVYHELETEYYQTIIDLSKEGYDKLSSPRINENFQIIREQLKSSVRDMVVK